jgi:hypothetical protein
MNRDIAGPNQQYILRNGAFRPKRLLLSHRDATRLRVHSRCAQNGDLIVSQTQWSERLGPERKFRTQYLSPSPRIFSAIQPYSLYQLTVQGLRDSIEAQLIVPSISSSVSCQPFPRRISVGCSNLHPTPFVLIQNMIICRTRLQSIIADD